MAIEFLCPYCNAAIRVADAAAGKQGKCPACTKRVLVPHVEVQPSEPASQGAAADPFAAVSAPAAPFDFDSAPVSTPFPGFGGGPLGGASDQISFGDAPAEGPVGGFVDVSASAEPPGGSPLVGIGSLEGGPTPFPTAGIDSGPSPLAMKYARAELAKRRRKRALLRMVVPLISIGALLGLIAALTWKPEPKLEGKLEGSVVSETYSLPVRAIPLDTLDVPPEVAESVLDALAEHSELLLSDRMRMKIGGDRKRGLEISIEPGVQMQVFQVDVKRNSSLSNYCSFEKDLFNELRLAELKPALKKMVVDYEAALQANAKHTELSAFRDPVGLAGSTGGVGYVVHAVVGSSSFRCVGEDSDGRLYFLLPKGTSSFGLTGRKLPDGTTPFKGKYVVELASSGGAKDERDDKTAPSEDDEGVAPKMKLRGGKPAKETEEMMESTES